MAYSVISNMNDGTDVELVGLFNDGVEAMKFARRRMEEYVNDLNKDMRHDFEVAGEAKNFIPAEVVENLVVNNVFFQYEVKCDFTETVLTVSETKVNGVK